jgi:O-acetyl-ADP-ribose deacetylase (regulator of RNase III)
VIRYAQGDLFDSDAQVWVNAVNCDGIMGAGIALRFKKRFPTYFKEYHVLCDAKKLRPGRPIVQRSYARAPLWIISFPTKDKLMKPAILSFVDDGLKVLRQQIEEYRFSSVAIPALGCGLGGLSWKKVRPIIERELSYVDCDVIAYEPHERNARRSDPSRSDHHDLRE